MRSPRLAAAATVAVEEQLCRARGKIAPRLTHYFAPLNEGREISAESLPAFCLGLRRHNRRRCHSHRLPRSRWPQSTRITDESLQNARHLNANPIASSKLSRYDCQDNKCEHCPVSLPPRSLAHPNFFLARVTATTMQSASSSGPDPALYAELPSRERERVITVQCASQRREKAKRRDALKATSVTTTTSRAERNRRQWIIDLLLFPHSCSSADTPNR